jgi:RND family efflux transporter MFP subunit
MKKGLLKVSVILSVLLVACTSESKSTIDELKEKQAKLKQELAEINQQLVALDTTQKTVVLNVTSTKVEVTNFQHKIELQGMVESDQNILLIAEMPGKITKVYVKEGQKVSRGQLLVTIDDEVINSNIEEVKTALEMADYMFKKQKKLLEDGVGTEIEFENAKNQKKSLEAKLKSLYTQKSKANVKAPFSGIIDEVMVTAGEMASPQSALLRLVNNSDIKITASVSENHLQNVKLGTLVDVVFPNLNDSIIKSKVTYVGNYIDPVNRTFRVHVGLKNNQSFLPNQIAKINITDLYLDSALVVKTDAILQDTKDQNYVYKMIPQNDGTFKVKKVFVNVIKSYKGASAIEPLNSEELSIDTPIVLNGAKGLTESDIVKIQ